MGQRTSALSLDTNIFFVDEQWAWETSALPLVDTLGVIWLSWMDEQKPEDLGVAQTQRKKLNHLAF